MGERNIMRAVVFVVGMNIADAIQRMDLNETQLAITGAIAVVLFIMDFVDWI